MGLQISLSDQGDTASCANQARDSRSAEANLLNVSGLANDSADCDCSLSSDREFFRLGMAHDLGNLLQAIGSAFRLIDGQLEQAARPDLRQFTRAGLASVEKAAALSRGILQPSQQRRIQGQITSSANLRALHPVICLTAGSEVQVKFDIDPDTPGFVCNPQEFENVILNLVVNARDAMPSGGLLTISAYGENRPTTNPRGSTKTNQSAVFRVKDTGSGMPPEVAARAGSSFYTTKANEIGTGLGLFSVTHFARRYGGVVEIETTVGEGTSVFLRMPGLDQAGGSSVL